MNREGPQLEALMHRLAECPAEFLADPHHSVQGQVHVDAIISDGFITVATRYNCRDDEALILIADTGSGVSPEIIDKIFDPFFTTKPVDKGTGLGLSVTFGIIQEHGGKIEVESPPLTLKSIRPNDNQGTEFVIHLPVSNNIEKKDSENGKNTRS